MANITTIPNETLQQIFLICCDGQPIIPPSKRIKSSYGIERILSHVSRRWRDVATDTPQIWGHIAVSWNGHGRSSVRAPHADRVDTYLARSRYAPLDLFWRHWDMPRPEDKRRDELFWKILESFVAHSSRWKSLHVVVDNHAAASSFLTIISSTHAKSLQALNVDLLGIGERPAKQMSFLDQPETPPHPSLVQLHLAGWDLRHLRGPFPQISTLVVVLTSILWSAFQDFTTMLELIPSLETLVLKRPETQPMSFSKDHPMKAISLPRLRNLAFLTLTVFYDSTPLVMCRAISAPNLTSLHLINHIENEFAPLARFLVSTPDAPPYPNLQTLDFRPSCCNMRGLQHQVDWEPRFKQWLNSLPTATHLILRSDIPAALLLHPDLRAAFPSLRTITAFCTGDRKHPKRCKVIAFLRKLVAVRSEAFGPSQLKLCLFKPCSRASSNRGDVEWMRENAEVWELDSCPDELVGLDTI